jgi:16S rRNA (guanine966-N2)-methyltransferase
MRIIAGKFRSRRLRPSGAVPLRPTTDKLRETLFDVLTAGNPEALAGSTWLDLFAGTGAVGLEALSRGARQVIFVESSRAAADLLRRNLGDLKIAEGFQLLQGDVLKALRMLDAQPLACDYCFLDPPYDDAAAYQRVLNFLATSRLLAPGAIVIVEHSVRFDPGATFGALQRARRLDQGDAALSFYRLSRSGAD